MLKRHSLFKCCCGFRRQYICYKAKYLLTCYYQGQINKTSHEIILFELRVINQSFFHISLSVFYQFKNQRFGHNQLL